MGGNDDSRGKAKPQVVEVDREASMTKETDGEDVEGRLARDDEHVVEDDFIAGEGGSISACTERSRRSCRRAETPCA